jgi:phage shock protein PspC (stress-responsive transcriptional regulator)
MTEHSAPDPQPGAPDTQPGSPDTRTGLDKFFDAIRGIDIRRRTDDKWIGGVCSGLADRLGIDPVIVRAALVVLAVFGGAGITIYLLAWVVLPNDREEIVAQRAVRDGDGGSVVLLVFATLALLGGSWWSHDSSWVFPWFIIPLGLFVWWLTHRHNDPDADRRVNAHQLGTPVPTGWAPATAGPSPRTPGPVPAQAGQTVPMTQVIPRTPAAPAPPKKPGRRSGGPLMALLAIGLALTTAGSLSWAGNTFSWPGDHHTIAFAGALAATGLLMVVLGIAGWRAGFVTFLAVVLALTAWTSSVVPTGGQVSGRVGDATWLPTSVASSDNYRLGIGNGVLDLSGLPANGLTGDRLPAYVGLGELEVRVPEGLTVQVVGHVGLGEILLPGESQDGTGRGGQGGSDVSRSTVIGDGPVEVVVDAGVGVGQLTVVKE